MKAVSVIAAVSMLVGAACSSTSSKSAPTPIADAGESDVVTAPPTPDAGSPDASPVVPDAGDASSPPTCADKPNQKDCVTCCSTLHEAGAITYIAAIAECMCVPDKCQTQCADTFCAAAPRDPGVTCTDCLRINDASCDAGLSKACSEDPDCVAFNLCIRGAGCNTKN